MDKGERRSESFPEPTKRESPPFVMASLSRTPNRASAEVYNLASRIHHGLSRPLTSAEVQELTCALSDPSRYDWRARRLAAWALGRAEIDAEQRMNAAAALSMACYGIDQGISRVKSR